jgi:hypothetical protein
MNGKTQPPLIADAARFAASNLSNSTELPGVFTQVDPNDVPICLGLIGTCLGEPDYKPAADLNKDGCVDALDLDLMLTQIPVSIDLDCDGQADAVDLRLLVSQQELCAGDQGFDPATDRDGDGCADAIDLSLICIGPPLGIDVRDNVQ